MKKYYILVLLVTLIQADLYATIRYVNAAATGTNNGTSWANAFTTLQAGIAATTAGDTVWVANGIYKPTTTTSRTATFTLPSGVAIFGGFLGNESALFQRNYTTWQTVLSGDIGQPGIHTDNSYHVVTASTVSSNTRLDGFKIIYGRADGGSQTGGGGMYCTDGSPTVANCYFSENYGTGGGAFRQANSGTVTIQSCLFYNNTSSGYGGAIYVGSTFVTGNVNIRDCDISSNQAQNGGGCYFYTGVVTMDRCLLSGNTASTYAGAIYEDDPTLTVSNTLIVGNTASNMAVHSQDAGNPNPTAFINCTIAHNKNTTLATVDHLLDLLPSNTLRNSIVWGNAASRVSNFTPVITNTVLQPAYYATGPGSDTLNPQFVAPALSAAQAPFLLGSYDYHLKATSHAIDTGNNAQVPPLSFLDLAGSARIHNNRVDLGAYESSYCTFAPTSAPSGNPVLCPGNTLTLSVSGGFNFFWSTGATTNSITVTTPGTYNVAVEALAGCRAFIRKVVTASTTLVNIYGNPVLCPGDTVQLTTGGNVLTWSWNTGASTSGIAVTAPGTYKVTGTGPDGCSVSDSITITAGTTPQPVITSNNGVLQTGTFTTYQWQLNGTDIPGATGQSYTPTVNGTYTVKVTNAGGCGGTSPAQVITNVGIAETASRSGFHIFPNPASTAVQVILQAGATDVRFDLVNSMGQVVQQWDVPAVTGGRAVSLPMKDHPAGMYFLRFRTGGTGGIQPLRISGE